MKNFTSLESTRHLFGWADHSVFVVMNVVSMLIGVYFGIYKRQSNKSKAQYLLGGHNMSLLPIAASLIASNVSGISLVGVPSEVYTFGAQYLCVCGAALVAPLVINFIFLPVLYELQITSSYEYLEKRFNRSARRLASGMFTFQLVLALPCVVYVPALSFAQVTGVSLHLISPIVCAVCIFYTLLGGLKAVVWTDFLQATVTLGALLAIIVFGVLRFDGLAEIFEINRAGGRLEIFNMNPSPFVRTTFWTFTVGSLFAWTASIATNQGTMQRLVALPTYRKAQWSLVLLAGGLLFVNMLCAFCGLLIYAQYQNCDPVSSKMIRRNDQLMPLYVMHVVGHVPGLPGLFMAGIFSAALSTMSSFLNSLSGTLYEDFVHPCISRGRKITESQENFAMKAIVFALGVLSIAMLFVIERLGGILELIYSVYGITAGPLLALFMIGMLCPKINSKGVLIGCFCGMAFMAVVCLGAQWAMATGRMTHLRQPTDVSGCPFNVTHMIYHNTTAVPGDEPEVFVLFRFSFMYYALLGVLVVTLVAYSVCMVTGFQKVEDIDPRLLAPLVRPPQMRRHPIDAGTKESLVS